MPQRLSESLRQKGFPPRYHIMYIYQVVDIEYSEHLDQSCSHLVIEDLGFEERTIKALFSSLPLVTASFVEGLLTGHLRDDSPSMQESEILQKLHVDNALSTLFEGISLCLGPDLDVRVRGEV